MPHEAQLEKGSARLCLFFDQFSLCWRFVADRAQFWFRTLPSLRASVFRERRSIKDLQRRCSGLVADPSLILGHLLDQSIGRAYLACA